MALQSSQVMSNFRMTGGSGHDAFLPADPLPLQCVVVLSLSCCCLSQEPAELMEVFPKWCLLLSLAMTRKYR